MSNAYSQLHNYRAELIGPNYQLINAAGQFKQGTLNANRAKLQAVMDQIPSLDIAKGVDRDYAEKRFNIAADIIDKYASGDLSNSTLTNQLIGKLEEVVDDTVENAIVSTATYRQEQKAWKKLQEDHFEKYAQVNHAYAHQNADMWLNDDTVGAKYRGGGGVIEYQDIHKKFQDNIKNISDMLEAEWVEEAPGEGYFVHKVTKKGVDKDRLDTALRSLFNDKDYQQMRINGWGQYRGLDDDQLAEVYTARTGKKVEMYDDEIENLEAIISNKGSHTDAEISEAESKLEYLNKERSLLKNSDFNSKMSASGRASIESELYQEGFFGALTSAYSYTSITDTNSDEYADYKLKLEKNEREKEKHALEMMKLSQEVGLSNGNPLDPNSVRRDLAGNPLPSNVTLGQEQVLDYESTKGGEENLIKALEIEKQSISSVEGILEESGVSNISEVMSSKDFVWAVKSMAGRTSIKVGDKTINIDPNNKEGLENRRKFKNYLDNTINTSGKKQQLYNVLGQGYKDIEKSLYDFITVGDGTDKDAIPNYNFSIVKDKNGKMKYHWISDEEVKTREYNSATGQWQGGTKNTYKELLKKSIETPSKMKEDEKLTLELYTALYAYNDKSLTDAKRQVAGDYVNNLLSKLTPSSRKYIKLDAWRGAGKIIPNTRSHEYRVSDQQISEIAISDQRRGTGLGHLMSSTLGSGALVGDTTPEAAYEKLDRVFDTANQSLSDVYTIEHGMMGTPKQIVISKDKNSTTYDEIRKKSGIPSDFKGDLVLEYKQGKEGQIIGVEPKFNKTVTNTKDGVSTTTIQEIKTGVTISLDDLKRSGLPLNLTPSDNQYNALYPTTAKSLYIGNFTYDSTPMKNIKREIYDNIKTNIVDNTSNEEMKNLYEQHLNYLSSGNLSFKLVPVGGVYETEVYNRVTKDKVRVAVPMTVYNADGQAISSGVPSSLEGDIGEELLNNPAYYIQDAFVEYLRVKRSESIEGNK